MTRARTRLIKLGFIALAVVVAAFVLMWALRPSPVEVTVATAAVGVVETTAANTRAGTVKACRRAKLALPGGGQIAQLMVKEGARVKAGQVLMSLWNEDARSEVRVAEGLARAAGPRAEQACVLAEQAQREAERARALRAEGFVAQERADRAQAEARAQTANCAAAEAEVGRAQAQIAAARAAVARTVLRAPFAGVVAEVTGELGEFSTPSPPGIPTPPAVDLIDDSCLYVDAPIDEVDAPGVRVGMPARITLDAFPGRRFGGRVRAVAPYVLDVEKQARTVDVQVAFEQAGEAAALRVGFSADVEIVLARHESVLRIPTQALLEGNRVLVLRDGVLEERALGLGVSNWEFTEVKSGLRSGEEIVLSLEAPGVKAGARAVARRES